MARPSPLLMRPASPATPLHPDPQAGSAGFPAWHRAPSDPPSTLCRTTVQQNQLALPCLRGSRGPWDQVQTPWQTLEAAPELAPACLFKLLPGPLPPPQPTPCCPDSNSFSPLASPSLRPPTQVLLPFPRPSPTFSRTHLSSPGLDLRSAPQEGEAPSLRLDPMPQPDSSTFLPHNRRVSHSRIQDRWRDGFTRNPSVVQMLGARRGTDNTGYLER